MALEETTYLASIEILFPSRAINARWDTVITRDSKPVAPPSIHRKAFPGEDISEILPEIQGVVSADYVAALAQNAQLTQQVTQAAAEIAAKDARIAALEQQIATLQEAT